MSPLSPPDTPDTWSGDKRGGFQVPPFLFSPAVCGVPCPPVPPPGRCFLPGPAVCEVALDAISWVRARSLLARTMLHLPLELFNFFLTCFTNSLRQGLAILDTHVPWIQMNYLLACVEFSSSLVWVNLEQREVPPTRMG